MIAAMTTLSGGIDLTGLTKGFGTGEGRVDSVRG
jgi:hypothetical protein